MLQLALPQEIIKESSAVSIAFTVYNSTALFPVRNTSQDMTVSSTVVGSQVVSVQVSGIADGTTLTNPVTFQLRLTNLPTTGKNETITSRCVFWDFKASSKSLLSSALLALKITDIILLDDNGDWNTDGCNLTSFNQTTNVASCECDHLTNFALLVVSSCHFV